MSLLSSTDYINSLIRTHYNKLDEKKTIAVLVNDLATETYKDLDPDDDAPPLVKWMAVLELRQLARAICRERQVHDEYEAEAKSGSLFDFTLQPRYPAQREGCDAYVLRDRLTLAERRDNISRLRHEAVAKTRHADALEAETEDMIRRGELQEAEIHAN
jgi:hypothetical protein